MNEQLRNDRWSAVIVNYNAAVYLDGCLRALTDCDQPPAEIVVVDNASSDDSRRELTGWPAVTVEPSQTNLGFAGAANRGVRLTETPFVLVLNPDVEVDPGFGRSLIQVFATSPLLGAAGSKLRYPDSDVLQHAGGELDSELLTTRHRGYKEHDQGQWDEPSDVDFVTGGAIVLRRKAFDQVGGFDERFWPAYYEDVDLCLRLRAAGWSVRFQPELTAVHVESVALGHSLDYYRLYHRNRIRFALKQLSAVDWWRRFIPAEMRRLRGELSAVDDRAWPITSGASAVEELARTTRLLRDGDPALIDGEPLLALIQALDEVHAMRHVVPHDADLSGLGRLRDGVLKRLFGRQQVFNDAVTRALEAQDRVNRELTAQILLAMLDLSWRNGSLAPH